MKSTSSFNLCLLDSQGHWSFLNVNWLGMVYTFNPSTWKPEQADICELQASLVCIWWVPALWEPHSETLSQKGFASRLYFFLNFIVERMTEGACVWKLWTQSEVWMEGSKFPLQGRLLERIVYTLRERSWKQGREGNVTACVHHLYGEKKKPWETYSLNMINDDKTYHQVYSLNVFVFS